jgi:ferredoxin
VNLATMAERVAAIERSSVVLNAERCLHARGKFSACQDCVEACPAQAIQPGHPPQLDSEACCNCLACLPVCPTGALTADDAVPALLNCAARVEAEALEIVCQRHPRPEHGLLAGSAAIRVRGCLAGLGAGAYAALIALGARQVLVRADACAECAWAALAPQVRATVEQAQRLAAPWVRAEALVCVTTPPAEPAVERPLWEAENPPLSRRDIFRLASRRGQVLAARAVTEEAASTARAPSRERQRQRQALKQMPERATAAAESAALGPWYGTLAVGEACTACGACARICPTGALRLNLDTGDAPSYRLEFEPWACIGCGACRQACVPAAITVDEQPAFEAVFGPREPVTLRAGALARCARCKTWMAARPETRLCPTCDFRRRNPFGAKPIAAERQASA